MWLLEQTTRRAIEHAIEAGAIPSAEKQADYEARVVALSSNGSRALTVAGDNAEIAINGVLTSTPSFMAVIFGGGNTTYPEIIAAIAEAEQNDAISNITYKIDSPGGEFNGLFDTLAAMQSAKKPSTAVISNMGASAAYAIAAQADNIIASNRAARIGSIGVVADFRIDKNTVSISSTNAPKKRPDVSTPEGVAIVREELDALHEIFIESIATGRNVSTSKINAKFGQGSTLLASEALKRGMIDSIATTSLKTVKSTKLETADNGGEQPKVIKRMDINTLKTAHPDVYAAAVQVGIDQERDRVGAHLTFGEAGGDLQTAIKAISDGSPMTETLRAKYMVAATNRRDVADRESDDVSTTVVATSSESDDNPETNAVLRVIEAGRGIAGGA